MNVHSNDADRSEKETVMSQSQTILITGATTGIGRHAALHLAARGHWVIATGRKPEPLATLKAEAKPGWRLETVLLDVTDEQSIARAAAEVDRLTDGRGVDVLVNNAGYGLPGPLEELSDRDLRTQFDTNVFGLMAVTRAFLPKMRARGAGRIINVSSIGGRVTFPMMGAYHATKYAVEALSDALRRELGAFGVQVAVIEPGPIRTEFSNRTLSELPEPREGSPYAPIYTRARQIAEFSDKQAVGPKHTSRAITHAIEARRARVRYVVPRVLSLMLAMMGMMPVRMLDWVMAQFIGTTRKRLAAASTVKSPSENRAQQAA
jgi:short-subunit dehydrogenase